MSIDWKPVILAFLASVLGGCGPESQASHDGLIVGLLLPFTGSASATSSNFERAALYAQDRINAGGGIHGQRVHVVARDTHSNVERSLQAARELVAEGAVAVIGPESADIAEALEPFFAEQKVTFISPLVGAASEPGKVCDAPWIRLAPSAKSLGEALAKQVSAEAVGSIAIMYSSGAYDQALKEAVEHRFVSLGGQVAIQLELDPNAQSYASEVTEAVRTGADAVVLATSPRTGALFVNEFYALEAQRPRWFLSPLLKTDLLVQNVAPEALEGALGIAPKIFDNGPEFPDAFARRWLGDTPLEGAYFYYDAMVLLAVAVAKMDAAPLAGDAQSFRALKNATFDAASPPGEVMGWDEVESGMVRLSEDDDLYYAGLTGPLLLTACGSRRSGVTSAWSVLDGAIVTD